MFLYLYKDIIKGDKCYCSKCKGEINTLQAENYYCFPEYFPIVFNYGKNISYHCDVIIPEILDFSTCFKNSSFENLHNKYWGQSSLKYRCVGVVAHRGTSGDSGHYVAYCRGKDNNNWYLFDDDKVSQCNFKDCMNREDGQLVYMAFYERISNDEQVQPDEISKCLSEACNITLRKQQYNMFAQIINEGNIFEKFCEGGFKQPLQIIEGNTPEGIIKYCIAMLKYRDKLFNNHQCNRYLIKLTIKVCKK